MKIKNFIFVTFFLAVAGLGSALPSKHTKSSAVKIPTTNSTQLTTDNTKLPTDSPQVDQAKQFLLDAAGPAGAGISKECSAALLQIITSPEFLKCVPLAALLALTPVVTDPTLLGKFLQDPASVYTSSLEKPFTQFSDLLCAAPKCSDQGVAGAVDILQKGCSKDLDNELVKLAFAGTILYSPIRDITCLKDNNKGYCWDETILGITKLPKAPFAITKIPLVDSVAVADPQLVCTDCPQQMIVGILFKFVQGNKAAQEFLAQQNIKFEDLEAAVAIKCGASFLSPKGKSNEEL
uniref:Putative phosphorylase b kinase regulatory subunit alpha n=1 Tax=Anthurium amnicola TaxID=1678845 RepID=A0A1D1YEF7_9ARAE